MSEPSRRICSVCGKGENMVIITVKREFQPVVDADDLDWRCIKDYETVLCSYCYEALYLFRSRLITTK